MYEKFTLDNKIILITGATGSFGKAFINRVLRDYNPKTIRVYSRDELKQFNMQQEIKDKRLRFFIGDVRDKERLIQATRDADIIIHAAAMKQVPACEYNPFEAIKTNITGAINVVDAALVNKVPRVVALSTDKAVNPVNLYGATKLCSDKIFIHSNVYVGADRPTRFSLVRYGNVLGSRGSVIPVFLKQRETGTVTITDERMTRFWLTLDEAIDLVIKGLSIMKGGEIFVPRIPSMKITDLAKVIAPDAKHEIIGIRPGEKLHEVLVNEEEGRYAWFIKKHNIYVVLSPSTYHYLGQEMDIDEEKLPEDFIYNSGANDWWLSENELLDILKKEGLM
jgi:UDP-N-acetylglucosamine 4,6-dehydratase